MGRWVWAFALVVAGCSSTSDGGVADAGAEASPSGLSKWAVVQKTARPTCEKLKECYPDWFEKTFKKGTASATATCVVAVQNDPKVDTASTSCTAANVDACASDLSGVACPDGEASDAGEPGQWIEPASCRCYGD